MTAVSTRPPGNGQPAGHRLIDQPGRPGAVRLVCLPYAGGSPSAYRTWPAALEMHGIAVCPVRLPGRQDLLSYPPYRRMGPLVARLADEMCDLAGQPYALFGHSLGALVAFELARELQRRAAPPPVRLVVSGASAPHLVHGSRMDEWPDAELLDHIQGLEGTPEAVLVDEELAAIFLIALRADVELLGAYAGPGEVMLGSSLSVYGGSADPAVSLAELREWQSCVDGAARITLFPGGHFFPWTRPDHFFDALRRDLGCTDANPAGSP